MAHTLASISLFPATPEQTLESRRRSFVSWGADLTLEQFLARDALMDTYEQAVEGRLITWVLAPRDNPHTLDFICSCESFRREAITWEANSQQKVVGYGIASVFTPEKNRSHGYARHMMRLLHWVLADRNRMPVRFPSEWGEPPIRVQEAGRGWFSTLWSDVGRDFYRLAGPTQQAEGWVVRGAWSTLWDVPSQEVEDPKDDSSWKWLGEPELIEAWKQDAKNIELVGSPASPKRLSFAFFPSNGVAAFQHRRLSQYLHKDGIQVDRWGVVGCQQGQSVKDALSCSESVFASWMFEVRSEPKTLLITRLVSSENQFPALMKKIMREAQRYGLSRIEVYNLPEHLQASAYAQKARTIDREEHLPAFKWYGPEKNEDVDWLLNERFCWC